MVNKVVFSWVEIFAPANVTEPHSKQQDNIQRIQVQNNVNTWNTTWSWLPADPRYKTIFSLYLGVPLVFISTMFAFSCNFLLHTNTHHTYVNSTYTLLEHPSISRAIKLHHLWITSQCFWPNTHIWPLAKPWTLNTLCTNTHTPRWADPSSAAGGDFLCWYHGWNM